MQSLQRHLVIYPRHESYHTYIKNDGFMASFGWPLESQTCLKTIRRAPKSWGSWRPQMELSTPKTHEETFGVHQRNGLLPSLVCLSRAEPVGKLLGLCQTKTCRSSKCNRTWTNWITIRRQPGITPSWATLLDRSKVNHVRKFGQAYTTKEYL